MKEFSHLLRKSYIDRLDNLQYKGATIPVNDELLTSPPAVYTIAGTKMEAYIIITNQTSNDATTSKCADAYLASLQLDIVTKYNNPNAAGKLATEEIAALVFDRLDDGVALLGFNIWRHWLETNRGLREDSNTYRIYRKILVFSHQINE